MRRPRSRALLVGLLAVSVLSLSVQHALYLCGSSDHGESPAAAATAAGPRAGCHDAGAPQAAPDGGRTRPACCGAASLASLPSGREVVVAPGALGSPLPLETTAWSAATLLASSGVALREPARDRRAFARLRPHLALRKILV